MDAAFLVFIQLFVLIPLLILQPELVQRVEKDLLNIMSGVTVENADILSFKLNIVV